MANYATSALKLSDTYVNTLPYNTCSTEAATVEKVVSAGTFALETGAMVVVKFTVTNSAANPTLNVSSTGAKAIYYKGAAITAGYLKANYVYTFIYNGTQWDLVGEIDTNSDTKVTQNAAITNAGEYPVLLAYSTATSKVTNALNKASTLTYNPSTQILTAPTFKGALTGNANTATKATQDGDGNVITSTYVTSQGMSNYVGPISMQLNNLQTKVDNGLATKTTLFTGTPSGLGDIIVSESIYNFDLVIFTLDRSGYLFDVIIDPSQYAGDKTIAMPFYMATGTTTWQHLTIGSNNNGCQFVSSYWKNGSPYTLKNVCGIKFS